MRFKQPRVRDIPRDRDDVMLRMIEAKCLGQTWDQVGEIDGITGNAAQCAVNPIRRDDIEWSGEPAGVVRAGYW